MRGRHRTERSAGLHVTPRLCRAPPAPPRRAEFLRIAGRTGLGFVVMGLIGFFVKLVLCVPLLPRSALNVHN